MPAAWVMPAQTQACPSFYNETKPCASRHAGLLALSTAMSHRGGCGEGTLKSLGCL